MDTAIAAEFFGLPLTITAPGLTELLRFHMGPHALPPGAGGDPGPRGDAVAITVRSVPAEGEPSGTGERKPLRAGLPLEVEVTDAAGAPVLRRLWRGWGNVPPPLPPFALWPDRFAATPAVVLAKGEDAVALLSSPDTRHIAPAVALARRGWRFVSGSLLVFERATGTLLPCQLPLRASGRIAQALRGYSLPAGSWRSYLCKSGHEEFLVRPEVFGAPVPIGARLAPPTLIRVCGDLGDGVSLKPDAFRPAVWPAAAGSALDDLSLFSLALPDEGSPEAGRLIDQQVGARPRQAPAAPPPAPPPEEKEEPCRFGPTTRRARRAGSTASQPI